jgi:hypothetical protein
MKLIANQKGVSADTSKGLVLTVWTALTVAVDSFIARVAEAPRHVEEEYRNLTAQTSRFERT